jgi:N-acetylneuraminate synthase
LTKFIAEICSNHNGNLDRALRLIAVAAEIGCDGVKFQLFRIDSLFCQRLLSSAKFSYVNKRRKWEMPLDWLPTIREQCDRYGLEFGCTPFYLAAVDELVRFVDFFKVASYELLWFELLEKILLQTDKPVVVSTGMATYEEIVDTIYQQITKIRCRFEERVTLLHCISQYPAGAQNCNLAFIDRLRGIYAIDKVGWSDHSVNAGVINRAVNRFSADIVEFHLDLDDQQGEEYDLGHCWTASQMKAVILSIKDGESADGDDHFCVTDNSERHFRADPSDGLRPMKYMRKKL